MDDARLELVPTAVAAGGDALARDGDGRVVFVEGALPGERVAVRITEARKDYARAVVVDVLDPSPDRVAPPCPTLAAGCGGCTWQHVTPAAQSRLKAAIVVDALRRIARLPEPPVPSTVALDGLALRTTARLAVTPGARAGHRPRRAGGGAYSFSPAGAPSKSRASRSAAEARPETPASSPRRGPQPRPVPSSGGEGVAQAIETDTCLVTHPLLEDLIVHGRYGGVGEVVLRVGVASGERLVRLDVPVRKAAVEVPDGVVVVGEGSKGAAFVHEEVAGRRFRVSADSFFQPGPVAAAGLAAAVSAAAGDALGPGSHLVDAYAGTGLFASVLGAASGARVTAVESDRSAAADARANLADLDAKVVQVEVGRWDATRSGPADVVVADPARSGLGRPGVAALVAAGAARMVVVSCDPASLARDTVLLAAAGYRLTSVALVDAFPHTFHVEAVARFDR